MNEYDEMFDAIKKGLQLQQLTVRNQQWAYADDKEQAEIISKQITDILNPKHEDKKTIQDLTKDALSGGSE